MNTILLRTAALAALLALGPLAGCGEEATPAKPVEITADTACSLDGMLLQDYPGPKGQIHYAGDKPDFFCDTVELFSVYLRPEAKRRVTGVYVQDMANAEWTTPKGHWIDAKTAWFVAGSKRTGSMGPTFASFAQQEDARKFAQAFGGKVLRFDQVTPAMASLDGGVIRDEKM